MSFIEKLFTANSHVYIHDDKRADVEQIIRSLINDGRKMLHVVADFDYTLTMYEKDGLILPSTFGVLENNPIVTLPDGSSAHDQSELLRLKYEPIEHDVNISEEEKILHTIEWWRLGHDLLLPSNLNKSLIRQLVHESKMELKPGVQEFITELLRSKTPILILSAGLGDVIEYFLEKEIPEFKHNHESSHIISNFFQYGENGNLISYIGKLIHPFNKNDHESHDTPYYQTISNRSNVILLGDAVGDVGMVGGMNNIKQLLKIGYLNHSTPAKLEVYKTVYDIVICDDQTFDIPNMILKAI